MFSIGSIFSSRQPSPDRYDLALQKCATPPASFAIPRRQIATDARLYFSVRSMGVSGATHLLQYAFADDLGNVVLSAIGAAPRPPGLAECEPPADLPLRPLAPDALEDMLAGVCHGASLVTFGRVLQTGLLPARSAHSACEVDCAWRRFLRISRQRQIAFDRHEPLTLSDAVAAAGLPPLESADAALRALAIRDLWIWMDSVELRTGWL
jgi:hypothetical protein